MDIYEIRRENLKFLVDSADGPTQFGALVGRSQSQISQLLKSKPIGSRLARSLEKELNLEKGYFDRPQQQDCIEETRAQYTSAHHDQPPTEAQKVIIEKIQSSMTLRGAPLDDIIAVLDLLAKMSPDDRARFQEVGRAFAKPSKKRNNHR